PRAGRHRALVLRGTSPPAGRVVLVNGLEVWAETASGSVALSSHRYAPDVTHPDGASRIVAFATDPWPRWTFALPDGSRIEHECFVRQGSPLTVLAWWLVGGKGPVRLHARPPPSGRDFHAPHREDPAFRLYGVTAAGHTP